MFWLAAVSATRRGVSPLLDVRDWLDLPPANAMTGEPVNPWNSIDAVVSTRDRSVAIEGDDGVDPIRICRIQVETRHLPHPDAVE